MEIYRILLGKFQWQTRRIHEALDLVLKRPLRCTLLHNVHVYRDSKDDMFL